MKRKILIIDDELSMCTFLSIALKREYDVKYSTDAADGLKHLREESFDLVLLDMIVGSDNGLDILERIKRIDESVCVIIMTAFGSIRTSVEAIRKGAFTYLAKPLDMDELNVFISQALQMKALGEEVDYLSDELKSHFRYSDIVGESAGMRSVYALIDKLKDVDASVTISGESGTGKELVARALHFSGRRGKERFVVINCAAIPESMLEEELFGHKRGSFTGAMSDKKGKFEIADKGTIFLDEIGDMPLGLQSKLLRVLQQKEFTPLGGIDVRKVDVRIIAATNRNLDELVSAGTFRQDLLYRLNVVNIKMPALRERKQDIPLLCKYFLDKFAREQNKRVTGISPEAERVLLAYDYPGNVRQLANILEYATILSDSVLIKVENLPAEVRGAYSPVSAREFDEAEFERRLAGMSIKQLERAAIGAALKKNNGRRDITAQGLGISVRSLQNKIAEYKL